MSIQDFMPQSLFMKVVGWLIVAGVITGSLWLIVNHFENVGYQKRVAEDTLQINQQLKESSIRTQQLQTKLDGAKNELNIARQKLETLSANNTVLVTSLRESITAYNGNLSNDSKQALVERVATLSSVLEECTIEYSDVASKADAYAADLKMMQDSWPE